MMERLARFTADRNPKRSARLVVAVVVAAAAGFIAFEGFRSHLHSDFGAAWFGAGAMLEGRNPYELIGRGREFEQWPLLYPATALVTVVPFTPLSERTATVTFVVLSALLLGYGATRNGWHLLPMFLSDAFVSSAKLGQWSILFAAAIFFPRLAIFSAAKPQAALPVMLASPDRRALPWALIGAALLVMVSLALFPSWPSAWLENVRASENMEPPIMRTGGFLVLAALFRWRRPEAWLLLLTACMPQAWGWYGTLALFTIPRSFLESAMLGLVAAVGALAGAALLPPDSAEAQFYSFVGTVLVLTIYLPCTALILSRSNTGEPPVVVGWIRRRSDK
jgi:hypothetical protein